MAACSQVAILFWIKEHLKYLYQQEVVFFSDIVTSKKLNCNKVSWLIFAFYEGWIFAKLVFPA